MNKSLRTLTLDQIKDGITTEERSLRRGVRYWAQKYGVFEAEIEQHVYDLVRDALRRDKRNASMTDAQLEEQVRETAQAYILAMRNIDKEFEESIARAQQKATEAVNKTSAKAQAVKTAFSAKQQELLEREEQLIQESEELDEIYQADCAQHQAHAEEIRAKTNEASKLTKQAEAAMEQAEALIAKCEELYKSQQVWMRKCNDTKRRLDELSTLLDEVREELRRQKAVVLTINVESEEITSSIGALPEVSLEEIQKWLTALVFNDDFKHLESWQVVLLAKMRTLKEAFAKQGFCVTAQFENDVEDAFDTMFGLMEMTFPG